jgi:elongation factor G
VDSVVNGLKDACMRGPLEGYPASGFDVVVERVERSSDTTPGAFRACSVLALATAMREGGAHLLEPVMKVEVVVPEAAVGQVLSDLTVARRAAVREVEGEGRGAAAVVAKHLIHADVPLSALMGYATALRSITQGEGSFSMEYSHYAPVSSHDVHR